ncbi:hypothetical protein HOY34_07005 [Xinfangfangia sp. D13-10-4-6]|uniref:hypothetical protein n=1 Tax=Pseudogemmobacter hezensis TaxID=2737662 RepID=UPI001554A883|nr:hypothetical protein [Pseudogemmobacter hezensis]NPD14955.1 hypothetical protein [Pseudogemmobacter hezensis]
MQRQLCLDLSDSPDRPPTVPVTPAILEVLPELLLMAAAKIAEGAGHDAHQDQR